MSPAAGDRESSSAANGKRAKIGDVAALAGVSLGAVSAVLNEKGRISSGTRERVRDAIRQLGYRPDLYASHLARRGTSLVGVIVSNLQNPFFAETAQAVEDEARRHGYQVSLMATDFSAEQHRAAVQQLLQARLAGLAVLPSEHDAASRRLVIGSGVRAVLLDAGRPEGNSSTLRVDAGSGMRSAVEHLLALGHRELLYVRNSPKPGEPPLRSHTLRDRGFAAAVRSVADPRLRTHTVDVRGAGAEAGEAAVAEAWGKHTFTAVIATTDMIAMGVYRALQDRGTRIPEDVSVVGFDNTYFSRFLTPPLTTVDIPRLELARLVVQGLVGQESGRSLRLGTQLVQRSSTAAPQK